MAETAGPEAFGRALRRLYVEKNRYAGSGPVSEADALAAFEAESPASGRDRALRARARTASALAGVAH